ncbi:MAG: PaaI family thioesterase [Desulfobacterales bacterium]|nr:MAG: PaaI family thioesterase [Desulfobacterales bacterium]
MSEYEDVAPKFREAMINKAKVEIPFWKLLGMEVADIKKGQARIRIPYAPNLTNANGVVHGGVIFSAADAAVGTALVGMVDRHELITTIEMKINYLKPVDGCDIFAEAHIIHKGTQTAIAEVEVRDTNGNLVAKALATYAIIKKSATDDKLPLGE